MDPRHYHILLLEDDEDNYILTRDMLAEIKDCQYQLDWTQTFDDAIVRMQSNPPDVALVDYHLGKHTGLEFVRHVAANDHNLPTIVLTGQGDRQIDLEAMQSGAADYLVKGQFNAAALERAIRYAVERQRAEEALRASEERFRALARAAIDAIIVVDSSGKIILWNPAAARIFLYPEHEALGKSVSILMPESDQMRHRDGVRHYHATGESKVIGKTYEGTGLRKDGSQFPVEISLSTWETPQGRFFGAVIRDITERKRTEERIERQLSHLSALREIDSTISGTTDLNVMLMTVLNQIPVQLQVDAADVLLYDPATLTLRFAVGRGFRTRGIERTRFRLGEGHSGRVALERKMIVIHESKNPGKDFMRGEVFAAEGFTCYWGVPLIAKGQIEGVLEVFTRQHKERDEEWQDFLETLAGQAAIAINNATLFDGLQRSNFELRMAYDATIEGWSHAMDLRDHETEGHSLRVTALTERFGRAMGLSDSELIHLRRGALLHDIGKISIPDSILLKPGALTDEEWILMRQHPTHAYTLLSPIAYLRPALDIPYCHHEKWDGTGYPRGLRGEQIPLTARLFAIVDVWDAVTSDRPYRPAWSKERALDLIRNGAGTHFDPRLVQVFLRLLNEEHPQAK